MAPRIVPGLWFVAMAACGRTPPNDFLPLAEPITFGDAGTPLHAECVENGHCDDESICIDYECVLFGECLRDFHCAGTQHCLANECRGELPPANGSFVSCQINADCPDHYFCVDDGCRLGVECLVHAHCPAGEACLGRICVPAL